MGILQLDVHSEPGFITLQRESGPPEKYPVADLLRAADIPVGLTHAQVEGISLLANLMVVLMRTLIEKDVIGEDFTDELGLNMDLNHLIYVVEQLGGSFDSPQFNNVEVS